MLDGQQRVTSIFASFQTELPRPEADEWTEIYFDYRATADPQDSSFFALREEEADPDRFFPVRVLFDSSEYRKATEGVDAEFVSHIDDLQSRIKEALIPVELLRTDDRAKVAIVFLSELRFVLEIAPPPWVRVASDRVELRPTREQSTRHRNWGSHR